MQKKIALKRWATVSVMLMICMMLVLLIMAMPMVIEWVREYRSLKTAHNNVDGYQDTKNMLDGIMKEKQDIEQRYHFFNDQSKVTICLKKLGKLFDQIKTMNIALMSAMVHSTHVTVVVQGKNLLDLITCAKTVKFDTVATHNILESIQTEQGVKNTVNGTIVMSFEAPQSIEGMHASGE